MRKIANENFIITPTSTGHTVRWKHCNAAIRTFRGSDSAKRAWNFIKFLVDWYSDSIYEYDEVTNTIERSKP